MTDVHSEPFSADQIAHLLRCTRYAPSPRGVRPWRLRVGPDRIEVFAHPSAVLAVTDRAGRQQTFSCGLVVYYLRVSMASMGFDPETTWLPDPRTPDHLATIARGRPRMPTEDELHLHRQITHAPSNRYGYQYMRVEHHVESAVGAAGRLDGTWVHVVGVTARERLVELHMRAAALLVADPEYRRELTAWEQATPSPPGHLGGSRFLTDRAPPRPYLLPAPVSPEDMVDQKDVLTALVVGHHGDSPEHWLRAGAATARLGLDAAGLGLAMSFFSQVVEVPELREQMTEEFALPGPPHAVIRLGYPAESPPGVPRRGVYLDRFRSLVGTSDPIGGSPR